MLKPEAGLEPTTCRLQGGCQFCSEWLSEGGLQVALTPRNVSRNVAATTNGVPDSRTLDYMRGTARWSWPA